MVAIHNINRVDFLHVIEIEILLHELDVLLLQFATDIALVNSLLCDNRAVVQGGRCCVYIFIYLRKFAIMLLIEHNKQTTKKN